jgi:hypothetical protein
MYAEGSQGTGAAPVPASVGHHLIHQADGGSTRITNCVLLCQFHHDVCIHRWGWRLVLHPDATTSAFGPRGQELHSHGPPGSRPPDTTYQGATP